MVYNEDVIWVGKVGLMCVAGGLAVKKVKNELGVAGLLCLRQAAAYSHLFISVLDILRNLQYGASRSSST